jgi:hypothetical protein
MDRIKDVKQLRLQKDYTLLEVKLKKSVIIKPDDKGVEFDYCKVIKIGKDVDNVEVGDIVLEVLQGTYHDFKIGTQLYLLVRAVGIKIATPESNFDNKEETKAKLLN